MSLKKEVRKLEGRVNKLETFCHRVEEVLLLSMEFNPFEQCCSDDVDQLILKLLVEQGRATTTELTKLIRKPLIAASKKPITRYAVFHRIKRIRDEARRQEREELLVFHPEKSGKYFRFWAVDPLLIDKLREQAASVSPFDVT